MPMSRSLSFILIIAGGVLLYSLMVFFYAFAMYELILCIAPKRVYY